MEGYQRSYSSCPRRNPLRTNGREFLYVTYSFSHPNNISIEIPVNKMIFRVFLQTVVYFCDHKQHI